MKETFEKRPTRTDLRITAYVGKLPSIGKKNMSKGTHVYGKRPTKRNPRIAAGLASLGTLPIKGKKTNVEWDPCV